MKKQSKLLILIFTFLFIMAAAVIVSGAKENEGGVLANGVKYSTFEEAFDALNETGGKIILCQDVVLDTPYALKSNIEIDLAGYELAVYGIAFSADSAVDFTISGKGTINAFGTLYRSTSRGTKVPNFYLKGTDAPIHVNFNGESEKPLILVNGANCFLENLEVRSSEVRTSKTVFGTDNESTATLNFNNVNVIAKNHLGQNSSVLEIRGSALFNIKNSSFLSNTAVVKVLTNNTETMLQAENSQFINRATTGTDKANETGVIGVYNDFAGKMYFKNSVIEAGYRPILLKGTDTCLIHLDGSVLKHTQAKSSAPIRTCNITFANGSSFIVGRTIGSLSDASGIVSNIDFELGTRMSVYVYKYLSKYEAPEIRIVKNLVNSLGQEVVTYVPFTADCDYEIIYDPIGDADAPYVVVDKYERNEDGSVKLDGNGEPVKREYAEYDIGNLAYYLTGASLPEATIWKDQKYNFQFSTSLEFPNSTYLTWNSGGGSLIGYTYGGNSALKYLRGESTAQTCMMFGDKLAYNAAPVMVFEVDFATDSDKGFVNGAFNVNVRNINENGGGSNGTNITISESGVANYSSSPDTKYTLDKNTWHRITIVFYTDTSLTGDYATGDTGKAYYYLDGNRIGESVAYKKNAAYVYGIRFDTNATAQNGSSMLFDNLTVRTFDTYLGEGESLKNTNPEAYLLNGGKALDMPLGAMGAYSVGGVRYDTVEQAVAAAEAQNSFVSLIADVITPVKVTVPCLIYANGYTMNLTDDSMAALVETNADGSNYSYMFNERFNGLNAKYEWFFGDINSIEELKDPSKYLTTTVSIGEIPKYVGSDFAVEEDYYVGTDGIYKYAHLGWSRDIGVENAEVLAPITISDAINNGGTPIKLFPVFGYEKLDKKYTWAVTDTYGKVVIDTVYDDNGEVVSETLRAGTQAGTQYKNFWTGSVKLAGGQTVHLLADMTLAAGVYFETPNNPDGAYLPYGFNLNGYTLTIDGTKQNYGYGNRIEGVFAAPEGSVLNVYSSVAGAEIKALGYKSIKTTFSATPDPDTVDHSKNDYTLTGGIIFRMNANNSTLNVGNVTIGETEYSGENITLRGDCLAYAKYGENSEINLGGITYIRTSSEYPAVIETDNTNGSVNVDGSTFILAAGGFMVGNSAAGDNAASSVSLNSSLIIMKENGDDLVSRNVGNNVISIEDTYTNATLNGGANTFIGEGTAAYASSFTLKDGLINAKAMIPMKLSQESNENVISAWSYNRTAVYGNYETHEFTVADYNAKNAKLILPTLSFKILSEEDAIKYTYLGLGENPEQVTYYVPGTPTDPAPEIESYELTYVRLVHNGKFDKSIPKTAEQSLDFAPLYAMESKLEGLKTSVTLYTDFVINLYIPSEYEAVINGIMNGEKEIEYAYGELDGQTYMKLSVRTLPHAAVNKTEFKLSVTDSGYSGDIVIATSVVEYAKAVLTDTEKYTDTEKRLVYSILPYVNEAAVYNGGERSEELEALIEEYSFVLNDKNDYTPPLDGVFNTNDTLEIMNGSEVISSVIQSVKVRLSAAPVFVFTVRRGFVGTVTLKCGSTVIEHKVEAPIDRTIVLSSANAAEFGKTIYVSAAGTVNGEAVEFSGAKYNLATYMNYHVNNADSGSESASESERAVPVVKALLDYVIAADEYRASLLEAPDVSIDSSDEYVPEGDTPLGDVEIDG